MNHRVRDDFQCGLPGAACQWVTPATRRNFLCSRMTGLHLYNGDDYQGFRLAAHARVLQCDLCGSTKNNAWSTGIKPFKQSPGLSPIFSPLRVNPCPLCTRTPVLGWWKLEPDVASFCCSSSSSRFDVLCILRCFFSVHCDWVTVSLIPPYQTNTCNEKYKCAITFQMFQFYPRSPSRAL